MEILQLILRYIVVDFRIRDILQINIIIKTYNTGKFSTVTILSKHARYWTRFRSNIIEKTIDLVEESKISPQKQIINTLREQSYCLNYVARGKWNLSDTRKIQGKNA